MNNQCLLSLSIGGLKFEVYAPDSNTTEYSVTVYQVTQMFEWNREAQEETIYLDTLYTNDAIEVPLLCIDYAKKIGIKEPVFKSVTYGDK